MDCIYEDSTSCFFRLFGFCRNCRFLNLHRFQRFTELTYNKQVEQDLIDGVTRLRKKVDAVLAQYPEVNPDNVRHTLILLDENPWQRLKRSLTRGRAKAI